ncbi:T9SS type A sorting domain-containing protein [Flavobacterium sp. AS60]|uniref:T9SS type A sorting domain-containing protein n=1 Tax=Flavobacterium anseongense TaxID=2910677 RepID=UPI001F41762B|nr:T9SS type A sorting domain-containing protein [Flavobacterium sp. AS60]MCF6129198.1 T9SS type A sorting domain-containing protein [Flavobacterium sp. AS60]
MKKPLLLLLIFFSICINAQTPAVPPPLLACDDNNDGFAVFDLTSIIPTIGLPNPAALVVTYYTTPTDAENQTNPIVNPTSYVNLFQGQFIHLRILDTTDGQIYYSTYNLTVMPSPPANPAELAFCDMMELPIYNLSDANTQITGGATGFTITYHETLTDAEIGANPVGPGYIPINQPIQTLYANVVNPTTGCRSITTLTLNTHNCAPCTSSAPTNLSASNITDTTLTLNWQTTFGMGTQASLIAAVPYGSPPPASYEGTITVTSIGNTFTINSLVSESCYSIYMKGFCGSSGYSNWSEPLDICMPNCASAGACTQALVLNAFLDSNGNGIKDSGEVNFNNGSFVYQINDSGNNLYGASNNGSYYIYDANPGNSYDISFSINGSWNLYYSSSTTYTNITLPTGSGAQYLDFPILEIAPFVDAAVYLNPTGQPRPGFTYSNTIWYQNLGSQNITNGTITFTKHPTLSITSISQPGTTATSTGFTYDFTNLAPLESRFITIYLTVPTIPTVSLGDLVTNSVSVQIANDTNVSNNTATMTQTIIGSYDPNDKMESHGGKIVYADFTSNDYLYYTIQFENTGSASAEFIRVEDALDSQLDESTFEMLNASHTVNTKRIGSQLTWHFYNIDLPPTSSNPSGSHGYITFKIKPKTGYAIGDIIPNTASIYFDYNPPIVTNTFDTEFVETLGNPTFNANTISLYPNPANDSVTISNSNSNDKIATVVIYEVSGKRVYTLNKNTLSNISIDVSHFARGLYLVELISEDNTKITKKLLLK